VLSPEYRVIAYDLRRLGDSDTIPACRLVTVAGSNHYTVLLGETPDVKSALRAFLAGG
jgi:pimeloyl-ACP methyl ester carboxylesterase